MHAVQGTFLALLLSSIYSSGSPAPACLHYNLHHSVFQHGDRCSQSMQSSKVALMFLSKGEMPLEPLWRRWLEDIDGVVYRGCRPDRTVASEECLAHTQHAHHKRTDILRGPIASQHLFNVYAHPAKGFDQFEEGSIFRGYEISMRADTRWDFSSAAIYALIHAALHNPSNAFFVVLSEACAPLYPAQLVYLEIIGVAKSRLNPNCPGAPVFGNHKPNEYLLEGEAVVRRLNEVLEPLEWHWAKSATWMVLNRKHAQIVSSYPQDVLLELSDEYYVATLLHTLNLENETTCDWQGPTYTKWIRGDSHPVAYQEMNATVLAEIRTTPSHHEVECRWSAALATAGGQFGRVGHAWESLEPHTQLADTCPLFVRKVVPAAIPNFVSLLWPSKSELAEEPEAVPEFTKREAAHAPVKKPAYLRTS